jgi:hypothetical protein
MLQLIVTSGYRGYVGIEYAGNKLEEREGIRATAALLKRVRAELL